MPTLLDGPLGIDPRVDIVFHAVFADPAREAVRIDFLSAVCGLRLREARVTSPFSLADFEDDKRVVIDVLATDDQGRTWQIEMQRRSMPGLPQRMLYSWARLYAAQLERGDAFHKLLPVVGVWICEHDAFPASPDAQLSFRVQDPRGLRLHDDLRLEVLQLRRWAQQRDQLLATPAGRWFWFFNEAATAHLVPDALNTPALEEALDVLKHFHSDAHLGALYRARREFEHVEASWQHGIELERQAREQAERERDAEKLQKEEERRAKEEERRAKEEERRAKEAAERGKEEERRAREAAEARAEALAAELAALRAQRG